MADINQILYDLRQGVRGAFMAAKDAEKLAKNSQGEHALIRQELERQRREMGELASALQSVQGGGGGDAGHPGAGRERVEGVKEWDHIRYIHQIPGRRIPFDMVFNIPIGADIDTEQQQTENIGQDGPFVVVARMAAFRSQFQFTVTDDNGNQTAYPGRTFGRYRPVASSWDLNDASAGVDNPTNGVAFPGTGEPVYMSPSNMASFRSMEFDGLIEMLNSGAGYPRSNQPVPSAFWTQGINDPFELAALDFFERGETIQLKATPTHVNNPPNGNAFGFRGPNPAPTNIFPSDQSGFDVQEGISDPFDPDNDEADPVQRVPNGILTLVLHGFRIVQPPGPVRMS